MNGTQDGARLMETLTVKRTVSTTVWKSEIKKAAGGKGDRPGRLPKEVDNELCLP